MAVSSTERPTRPYRCVRVECPDCDDLKRQLTDAKDELLLERVENRRLKQLNAALSSRLADTSHRLIDAAFNRATDTIRKLGSEWPQKSQSMMFDEDDKTVVDMGLPL